VIFTIHKYILTVAYPIVLFVTYINKTIVSTPLVRVYNAVDFYFASNDPLQSPLRTIRCYLSIDLAATLKYAKDNGLGVCSASSLAFDAASTKIRFVYFDLPRKGRRLSTKINYSFSD